MTKNSGRVVFLLCGLLCGIGFGSSQARAVSNAGAPVLEPEPRFNEVFRNATHNSYWVHRSAVWDPFASGAQERLLDQMLFDRVRGLEIDVHKDPDRPGDWNVFHTDIQDNSFCATFQDCLSQLQQFQYALPQHEPLTVILELKEIIDYNFDSTHTPVDLDRLIESKLGPYLYRPSDFLARCKPGLTLRQCAAQIGWPTARELRGKIIFAVLGNWRWCTIGHGPSGWATYATYQGTGEPAGVGAANRSAFPMETDYGDWTKDTCGNEGIPEPEQTNAIQASIFLQTETLAATGHKEDIPTFLAGGGVIRADGTQDLPTQETAFDEGMQMYQTDYPWYQLHTPEWTQVFHALKPTNFTHPVLEEPGERLVMLGGVDGAKPTFAPTVAAAPDTTDWQAVVSSTRLTTDSTYPNLHHARGQGCLRAESSDGTQAAMICRHTTLDATSLRKVHGQNAAITVQIERHGLVIQSHSFYSADDFSNGIGDLIRLQSFVNRPGSSCVSLSTSSEMQTSTPEPTPPPASIASVSELQPRWTPLLTHCFDTRLPRQGIVASQGDVLFVRTRRNDAPMHSQDFSVPTSASYSLLDLSR